MDTKVCVRQTSIQLEGTVKVGLVALKRKLYLEDTKQRRQVQGMCFSAHFLFALFFSFP